MDRRSLKITHLKRGDGGWYLLFTGDQDDWTYLKEHLKRTSKGPFKGAWYVFEYQWLGRAKKGAWWVSESVLYSLQYFFSNLDEMLELAGTENDEYDDDPWHHRASSYSQRKQQAPRYFPPKVQEAYTVLGLPKDASKDDIKKKHRALAFANHPDRGGDLDLMKRINAANDLIISWLDTNEKVQRSWPYSA